MQHLSLIRGNEKADRPPKPLTATGPSTLLQQGRAVINAEPEALRGPACRLDERLYSLAEAVAKVRKVGLPEFSRDRLISNSQDCNDDE